MGAYVASSTRTPTLGPWVSAWIEKNVVYGEGDYAGRPFRLRKFQRDFINQCYELEPTGRRVYDRALLGLPKGNGKTPIAAAIAQAELDGPVVFDGWDARGNPKATRRTSPDIPVAAASFEQADLLFGDCRFGVKNGPLSARLDAFETEILPKEITRRVGSLYKVAAVAGTNDGRRPTFFCADELHEWDGKKERVHVVLSNGRAKRADAWELNISTAGWNGDSLLAKLCARGRAGTDKRLLVVWYEPPKKLNDNGEWVDLYDISKPDERALAIRAANPACDDFLSFDNIEARYHEIDEHEFRRYYLNQWTSVPEQWMDPEKWSAAANPKREVPERAAIALGFDGSYNQDSTALVGCTVDNPHLFPLGIWERPAKAKEWVVNEDEVVTAVMDAIVKYRVVAMPVDDTFGRIWAKALAALAGKGVNVIEFNTRSEARMGPACGQFWGAISRKALTHSGDAHLTGHLTNCRSKMTKYGPVIVKENKHSVKRIDAAVSAIIAYDAVVREGNGQSVYETRGILTV